MFPRYGVQAGLGLKFRSRSIPGLDFSPLGRRALDSGCFISRQSRV